MEDVAPYGFPRGFYEAFLRVRSRDQRELLLPHGLRLKQTSRELYDHLWECAHLEPFSATRRISCSGKEKLAEMLSCFAEDLSRRHARMFVDALFTQNWMEVVYEFPSHAVGEYRLSIDPETRQLVPYPLPHLRIEHYELAESYRYLRRVLERFKVEKPCLRNLCFPRQILMHRRRISKRFARSERGQVALEGILYLLQRLQLLRFVGPSHDPLEEIELTESTLFPAIAITQSRGKQRQYERESGSQRKARKLLEILRHCDVGSDGFFSDPNGLACSLLNIRSQLPVSFSFSRAGSIGGGVAGLGH